MGFILIVSLPVVHHYARGLAHKKRGTTLDVTILTVVARVSANRLEAAVLVAHRHHKISALNSF
jgi:hypothetical protein